ncbi:hypothetical protein BGX34_000363 [Mortierella sp. NVP85]|nr:hypothetical protein BGX34_000363 [Mortierella sp. NVP85]
MSALLSHAPIELRNPFSVLLEPEHEPTTTTSFNHPILTRTVSDDDLDRVSVSSWSVVNSAYASDDEDFDADEIYMDASGHNLAPMTVSSLSDGFTSINNIKTATSVNSTSVATQPDTWVIKVTKTRQNAPLRKHKTPIATAPSLEDVMEQAEWEYDNQEVLYVSSSMSDHELSKSSKAVKLKNVRLAIAHDTALCKALNITNRKANGGPRLPKGKGKYEKFKGRTEEQQQN